jgi:HSP20 family protein
MLMRFDPFRDLDRLADTMQAATRGPRPVPLDAYRRGHEVVAELDMPGVDPDGIDLTVESNVLTVRAERRVDRRAGDEILVAERLEGVYSRQLFLGETLDADRLEARYQNGVLTLRIPIADQAKPRRIAIAVSDAPQTVQAETAVAAAGPDQEDIDETLAGDQTGAARQPGDEVQHG